MGEFFHMRARKSESSWQTDAVEKKKPSGSFYYKVESLFMYFLGLTEMYALTGEGGEGDFPSSMWLFHILI